MAQASMGTIDPNLVGGTQLAQLLNQWQAAVNSQHSGGGRPNYAAGGMLFINTSNPTQWELRWFDGTNDFPLASINPGTTDLRLRVSDKVLRDVSGGLEYNGRTEWDSTNLPAGAVGKSVLAAATQSAALTALGAGGMKLLGTVATSGGTAAGEVSCGGISVIAISSYTVGVLYGSCNSSGAAGAQHLENRIITGSGASSNYVISTVNFQEYDAFCIVQPFPSTPGSAINLFHYFYQATGTSYSSSSGVLSVFAGG